MSDRGPYNVTRKLYRVPVHLTGEVVVEATSITEARELARDMNNHISSKVNSDTKYLPMKTGILCLGRSPIIHFPELNNDHIPPR